MEKQRVGLDALRPGQRGILREILMPDDAKSRMEELGLLPDTAACIAHHMRRLWHMRSAALYLHCGKRMRHRLLWRRSDEPEGN